MPLHIIGLHLSRCLKSLPSLCQSGFNQGSRFTVVGVMGEEISYRNGSYTTWEVLGRAGGVPVGEAHLLK